MFTVTFIVHQVTVEEHPEVSFTHSSALQCWELVRERLNEAIIKHRSLGNTNLPPLQTPDSVNGLEMFGFLSPLIVQVCLLFSLKRLNLYFQRNLDFEFKYRLI